MKRLFLPLLTLALCASCGDNAEEQGEQPDNKIQNPTFEISLDSEISEEMKSSFEDQDIVSLLSAKGVRLTDLIYDSATGDNYNFKAKNTINLRRGDTYYVAYPQCTSLKTAAQSIKLTQSGNDNSAAALELQSLIGKVAADDKMAVELEHQYAMVAIKLTAPSTVGVAPSTIDIHCSESIYSEDGMSSQITLEQVADWSTPITVYSMIAPTTDPCQLSIAATTDGNSYSQTIDIEKPLEAGHLYTVEASALKSSSNSLRFEQSITKREISITTEDQDVTIDTGAKLISDNGAASVPVTITVDESIPVDSSVIGDAILLHSRYYTLESSYNLTANSTLNLQLTKKFANLHKTSKFYLPLRISTTQTGVAVNESYSTTILLIDLTTELWDITWSDEFQYKGAPDKKWWGSEYGYVRNEEWQWYQAENGECDGEYLVISAKRETFPNPNYEAGSTNWKKKRKNVEYTSSCFKTPSTVSFHRGVLEVRARIPYQKGAWPAIWTLGKHGEWPSCGEIDILELYRAGASEAKIWANFCHGSATRWSGKWNSSATTISKFVEEDPDWKTSFHTWKMVWNEETIDIYLDDKWLNGTTIAKAKNADVSWAKGVEYPFDQPHYILLNLAIGANGGDPSGTTFPLKYEIDYVRIYQKAGDEIFLTPKEVVE